MTFFDLLPAAAWEVIIALGRASVHGALAGAVVFGVTSAWRACPVGLRAALWWLVCARFVVSLASPAPLELAVLPWQWAVNGTAAAEPAGDRIRPIPPVPNVASFPPRQAIDGVSSDARDGSNRPGPATPLAKGAPAPNRTDAWSLSATPGAFSRWWPVGIVGLWLLGVVAALAHQLESARRTRHAVARGLPAPIEVQRSLRDLCETVGIVRVPQVLVSPLVTGPCLTFVRGNATVLLPPELCARGAGGELRYALCHELLHARRRDLAWSIVPSIAERLFFFHPVARLAAREFVVAREASCDAAVIELLDAPVEAYAHLIVRFSLAPAHGAVAMGGGSSIRLLKRRLLMLHDRSSSRRASRPWLAFAAVVGLLPFQVVARPAPADSPADAQASAPLQSSGRVAGSRASADRVRGNVGGVIGGVTGGVEGGIADGVTGGVIGGVTGGVESRVAVQSSAPPPAPPASPAPPAPAASAAPPTPPVAPAPPAPPAPPPPPPGDAWWYRFGDDALQGVADAWVFLGGDYRVNSADQAHIARAEALREGSAPLFWFERDGQEYVIRDAATLREIERMLEHHRQLGAERGQVGGKQGDLGTKMGRLGARQGELGAKQAELAARQAALTAKELQKVAEKLSGKQAATAAPTREAETSKADREQLEREMERLSDEMRSLASEQEKLGHEMEQLANEQVSLAKRHHESSALAAKDLSATLDRAIKDGTAKAVK